jgi:hypothetical protein
MYIEKFESDKSYENGTLVVFGGEKDVTISTTVNDTRIAGIIYNDDVVLQGKTRCKIIGRIKKGDLITTSNTSGCGIKASTPMTGSIIGKSLEDKDTGEVKLVVIIVGIM